MVFYNIGFAQQIFLKIIFPIALFYYLFLFKEVKAFINRDELQIMT